MEQVTLPPPQHSPVHLHLQLGLDRCCAHLAARSSHNYTSAGTQRCSARLACGWFVP
jgi:hypothetical protein